MLLQNRNAFGHAFIKDIAGNAGDKPLQPTFPRSSADRKLVAGCYLCDRGCNVNPDAGNQSGAGRCNG
jgi:hypothetical protein